VPFGNVRALAVSFHISCFATRAVARQRCGTWAYGVAVGGRRGIAAALCLFSPRTRPPLPSFGGIGADRSSARASVADMRRISPYLLPPPLPFTLL